MLPGVEKLYFGLLLQFSQLDPANKLFKGSKENTPLKAQEKINVKGPDSKSTQSMQTEERRYLEALLRNFRSSHPYSNTDFLINLVFPASELRRHTTRSTHTVHGFL